MNKGSESLLDGLCVKQGFFLSPKEQNRIALLGSWETERFAKDVVASKGLNPEIETKHVRFIRNKFIEAFGSNVYNNS